MSATNALGGAIHMNASIVFSFVSLMLPVGSTQTLSADKGHEIAVHHLAQQTNERAGRDNRGAAYVLVFENAADMASK